MELGNYSFSNPPTKRIKGGPTGYSSTGDSSDLGKLFNTSSSTFGTKGSTGLFDTSLNSGGSRNIETRSTFFGATNSTNSRLFGSNSSGTTGLLFGGNSSQGNALGGGSVLGGSLAQQPSIFGANSGQSASNTTSNSYFGATQNTSLFKTSSSNWLTNLPNSSGTTSIFGANSGSGPKFTMGDLTSSNLTGNKGNSSFNPFNRDQNSSSNPFGNTAQVSSTQFNVFGTKSTGIFGSTEGKSSPFGTPNSNPFANLQSSTSNIGGAFGLHQTTQSNPSSVFPSVQASNPAPQNWLSTPSFTQPYSPSQQHSFATQFLGNAAASSNSIPGQSGSNQFLSHFQNPRTNQFQPKPSEPFVAAQAPQSADSFFVLLDTLVSKVTEDGLVLQENGKQRKQEISQEERDKEEWRVYAQKEGKRSREDSKEAQEPSAGAASTWGWRKVKDLRKPNFLLALINRKGDKPEKASKHKTEDRKSKPREIRVCVEAEIEIQDEPPNDENQTNLRKFHQKSALKQTLKQNVLVEVSRGMSLVKFKSGCLDELLLKIKSDTNSKGRILQAAKLLQAAKSQLESQADPKKCSTDSDETDPLSSTDIEFKSRSGILEGGNTIEDWVDLDCPILELECLITEAPREPKTAPAEAQRSKNDTAQLESNFEEPNNTTTEAYEAELCEVESHQSTLDGTPANHSLLSAVSTQIDSPGYHRAISSKMLKRLNSLSQK